MKKYTLNDNQNQMTNLDIRTCPAGKITYGRFKQAARELQIWWRENVLEVGYDRWENVLTTKDAKKGLVFYEGYRDEILDYLKRPVEVTSSTPSGQMLTNLLRSEHVPFNVFFPMQHDLEGCKRLFNDLIGKGEIQKINEIKIEYHPEPISEYLDDHTAFDVFISYTNSDGDPSGIGIEVKYTESAYPLKIGSSEYRHVHDKDSKYFRITSEIGWFKDIEKIQDALISNKFRQIWRNHILGASMIIKGCIKHFYSITLFPSLNVHFSIDALPKYKGTDGNNGLLSDEGFETCIPLTYEHLFDLMKKDLSLDNKEDWIGYLRSRYLLTALQCFDS